MHLIDKDKQLDASIRAKRTDVVLAEPPDATELRSRLSGDAAAPADAQALRARLTGHSSAPLVLGLAAVPAAGAAAAPVVSNCLLQASFNQSMSVMRTVEDLMIAANRAR